jgi:diaminohydroxyphosphoribosylaminopyrimidine deaminase/5-amino-6-(5-phosphoribosylamino)uracil reductase
VEKLKKAGIEVKTGVLAEEADRLNRAFFYFIKYRKPFVTAKLAISLDGKVRTAGGESKWITGPEARKDGHLLRHYNDAILVGVETVLADDPLLTIRHAKSNNHPVRIVLDHHLRTPLDAKLISNKEALTWIFTLEKNRKTEKAHALHQKGVKLTFFENQPLSIPKLLETVADEGIMTLLIEGGPTIQDAFFRSGFVNKVVTYIAPKIIGGKDALTAVEGEGMGALEAINQCVFTDTAKLGNDLKITAYYEVT